MVSCDWPVSKTLSYWPEFRGHNTVHNNWK